MAVEAILFDLDGTLVDSERESAEAMARALHRGQGLAIGKDDRDFIIGRSWVEIHTQLSKRYPTMSWTREELIVATAQAREEVFNEAGLTVLPGAREAVQRFTGLRLGLVTGSSTVEMEQALAVLGVRELFEVRIASEDVATSKPSPEGYLAAAKALGVKPRDCLVVEDSFPGIGAGRAAGMNVVAVRIGNYAKQDQSQAHVQIDTLDQLTEELLARAMVLPT